MSDDLPPDPTPDDDDLLAAELALGLIEGEDAQRAVARLGTDPGFAQQVRDWQERLAALADELVPVMPPARARQHLREALGHSHAPLSEPLDSRIRWWQRPLALFGAAVAVAALALVLAMPMLRGLGQPGWQAELVLADPVARVMTHVEGRKVSVELMAGTVPEGRDWQVWWIAPGGAAPVSLGMVARDGMMRMTLPQGMKMGPGVRIALSDEPAGGSPTGQATGRMIASAMLTPS